MRMRSATFRPIPTVEAEPLSAMNITPLIDVLLVLLVMMILTIPMMTHKVPVDLPRARRRGPCGHPPDRSRRGRASRLERCADCGRSPAGTARGHAARTERAARDPRRCGGAL